MVHLRLVQLFVRCMRPNFQDYALSLCSVVATRSTCDRLNVGAILTRDNVILATGYNGAPRGMGHCDDEGHELDGNHCVRTVHAEANAISQAAKMGTPINGSVLYCTHLPCYTCAKMLINAGVIRVIVKHDYHAGHNSREAFLKVGIPLTIIYDTNDNNCR